MSQSWSSSGWSSWSQGERKRGGQTPAGESKGWGKHGGQTPAGESWWFSGTSEAAWGDEGDWKAKSGYSKKEGAWQRDPLEHSAFTGC